MLPNWASAPGWSSDTPLAGSGQTVTISLSGTAPDSLKLELIHPTLEALDQHVLLKRSDELYSGTVVRADGRLHVLISDEAGDWRLTGMHRTRAGHA